MLSIIYKLVDFPQTDIQHIQRQEGTRFQKVIQKTCSNTREIIQISQFPNFTFFPPQEPQFNTKTPQIMLISHTSNLSKIKCHHFLHQGLKVKVSY